MLAYNTASLDIIARHMYKAQCNSNEVIIYELAANIIVEHDKNFNVYRRLRTLYIKDTFKTPSNTICWKDYTYHLHQRQNNKEDYLIEVSEMLKNYIDDCTKYINIHIYKNLTVTIYLVSSLNAMPFMIQTSQYENCLSHKL